MTTMRVAVQERQRLLRDGMAMVFGAEPDIEVVGSVATGPELVQLTRDERPEVVLLETDVAEWDPLRLVSTLRKRQRTLRVVGMAARLDGVRGAQLHREGVRVIVSHSAGIEQVLEAVRLLVPANDVVQFSGPSPETEPRSVLTRREV